MKKNIAILSVVGALLLPMLLVAQTLPPAASILNDYVKAVGGTGAFNAVNQ